MKRIALIAAAVILTACGGAKEDAGAMADEAAEGMQDAAAMVDSTAGAMADSTMAVVDSMIKPDSTH